MGKKVSRANPISRAKERRRDSLTANHGDKLDIKYKLRKWYPARHDKVKTSVLGINSKVSALVTTFLRRWMRRFSSHLGVFLNH
jgi:hypothetical protein